MEETITITDAQYYAKDGVNISIKAKFDGVELSIPLDSDNSDYIEIMRQVDAGTLTIKDAD
tara:strand:+ start:300 stop:482 length:183 start_codon:yes stop_codon:yes gene_type:complete